MNVTKTSIKTLAIWVLVLLMAITMFPVTAFADEHETQEATEDTLEEIVTSEVAFTVDQSIYTVDGVPTAMDVAPYIQDGRIMVPVAHVSRALGAEVQWEPSTRTVSVTSQDDVITMIIGSSTLMKNGLFFDEMDTMAVIKDIGGGLGRTMIPVSRLARALDVDYVWDQATRSAVFMPGMEIAPVEETFVFSAPGTFGPAEGFSTINKDVVIAAEGVTLQNYIITGDLIIAEEVGEGSVNLNNITVQGTTYVRGGGMESIYIDGGEYGEIIIEKVGGDVRIVIVNADGSHLIISEDVSGTALDRTEVILEGNFEKITVLASYIDITFKGETTVGEIIIDETAESVALNLSEDTLIELITSNFVNLKVEGYGTVKKDGGTERRSITYASTVTKPVVFSGGGGGGGGGTPPAPTPKVTNVQFGIGVTFETVTFDENNTATIEVEDNTSYKEYELVLDLNVESDVTVSSDGNDYEFTKTYDEGDDIIITIEELTGSGIVANLVRGQTLVTNSPVTITLKNSADTSKEITYEVYFFTAGL